MLHRLTALAGALMACFVTLATLGSNAQAHQRCRTVCRIDNFGFRVCRTICNGHGHYPGHPGHPGHGNRLSGISSSSALLLLSSASTPGPRKEALLMQVTEDAATFLESGTKSSLLASSIALAREEAAKTAGIDAAEKLTDEELVEAMLEAAEDLLSR